MDSASRGRSGANGALWAENATEDYVFTHADRVVHHRAQEIAEINAETPRPRAERTDMLLHWHGNDVVVVTYEFIVPHSRATDVWIREAGRWKLASAQVTLIVVAK
jgi:hypothetical protein